MAFSNPLLKQLLSAAFGASAFTAPSTVFVALSTTVPNPDGTGVTEPTDSAYKRVAVPNTAANWHAAPTQPNSGYQVSNAAAITFPAAVAPWGTVVAVALFDAATGGTYLGGAAMATPQTISTGTVFPLQTDSVQLSLA